MLICGMLNHLLVFRRGTFECWQLVTDETGPFHIKANKECGWLPDAAGQLPFCQISDDGNETMMITMMIVAFTGCLL